MITIGRPRLSTVNSTFALLSYPGCNMMHFAYNITGADTYCTFLQPFHEESRITEEGMYLHIAKTILCFPSDASPKPIKIKSVGINLSVSSNTAQLPKPLDCETVVLLLQVRLSQYPITTSGALHNKSCVAQPWVLCRVQVHNSQIMESMI